MVCFRNVFPVEVFLLCSASKARHFPVVVKERSHVVLCWLKEPGNAKHRNQIIEVSKSFQKIPGVLEVRAGQVVSSEREIVDDSFDVAILVIVPDQKRLTEYLDHPIHQKAKKDALIPLVDKIIVYDFKE